MYSLSPAHAAFSVAVFSPLPPAKLTAPLSGTSSPRAWAHTGSLAPAAMFGAAAAFTATRVLGAVETCTAVQPARPSKAAAVAVADRRRVSCMSRTPWRWALFAPHRLPADRTGV
ncbi:MAG: hypothetical protein A3E25_00510 [Burkholderiales bacterium RIFCSPHIGHO2_12_FULL_69_20]|nr:MAG: hypothetical protein A3E25_00510 [Burkholderiales bacterium RIFCSPHIGHO2_12_FULL_69_20]